MKTLHNTLALELSDVAAFRLRVLIHFYAHGLASAMDAYGVKKSTLYDWKKSYEQSGKKTSSLIPTSTTPVRRRSMHTDVRLLEFIKEYRATYGNVGKHKIKIFLDAYANELGIR
jgi:transposase